MCQEYTWEKIRQSVSLDSLSKITKKVLTIPQ